MQAKSFHYFATIFSLLTFTAADPCGETAARVCYDGTQGTTKQNVSLDDVAYVASYLRYIGQSHTGLQAMWRMPAAVDCQEWQLPVDDGGTVVALAKHIGHRQNTSVLYEAIANSIDGGENATVAQKKTALIGACGTNGGMVGVAVNASNPAYHTKEYLATGDVPQGILVKIVHNPGH